MGTFIALLRGINVSGQKLIKMEALRQALAALHLQNIQTYIQSGNVVFQSDTCEPGLLEQQISEQILAEFGFEVPVMVLTLEDLEFVWQHNPFAGEALPDDTQPYVAILAGMPLPDRLQILLAIDFEPDRLVVVNRFIYLRYHHGAGTTKLTNAVIENKLKMRATSRNWKTIRKLIEMAKNHG
ncbi:DUF1697 domain-containing protein [Flavobacterium magnum]|uniref:DUF1697 domain-containing protein n=1 Tax=Flavobacterium magnum TaxID=2162713 RepID=A0A2S0RIN3_9FLAO|nr:DUF1697 domain-containing protein [Flavobacterium magnum]AWA30582.1 DUF1697 domain-containing protein [Flavobacterium magnum]